MSLTRVRWLTAVCLSLGIIPLCQAQEVWRPVARSVPPVAIASTASPSTSAASPPATIGKPIAIASSTPAFPVVVRAAHQGGIVIRGQAPDLDNGSPIPPAPPIPPATGGLVSGGPYTPQGVERFNAPALGGVTIPLIDMAPSPTSGDPVHSSPGDLSTLPPPPPTPIPAVTIGRPRSQEMQTVSATIPAVGPVDPPPPSTGDLGTAPPQPAGSYSPYSISNQPDSVAPPGVVPPPADITPGVATDRPVAPGFWEKCRHIFDFGDRGTSSGRCLFQSDHSFDYISSPVTMPFYAEDPRSLTEVKPIFIYQRIPGNTPNFGGGNVSFLGTQARLAVTERFSVVMSELGYLWLDPKNPTAPATSGSGFSEIKIGPKYTFLRNGDTGTVGAFGVNFELPVGSAKNLQNTGSANIDPYFAFSQSLGRLPAGFGSLNFMNTTGYSASVDHQRADFFYTQLHLDYNVANANKFFPLIEMNYLHYTTKGNGASFGTEGADLLNLGSSTRRGSNYLSTAVGLRYRITDNIQAGTAIEVPLTHERGMSDYRMTFDVIFRY